jgi:uncharacterized protein with PIN domain
MTIRFYLDEDSSDTGLLRALRLRGVEVVGASESELCGRSDTEQLKWAASHQRVLYSSNRGDFYRLHSELMRSGQNDAGIILVLQQRYFLSAEEMENRLEFLSAWRAC